MTTANSFVVQADGYPHIDKDPDAVLDYSWDWTRWLKDVGVITLADAVVTANAGLNVIGVARISNGVVEQTIGGGTLGASYKATCRVTADIYSDDRTVIIDIREK